MEDLDIKYTGVATADDGRTGRVVSDDGAIDMDLTVPGPVLNKVQPMRTVVPERKDDAPDGTNPEQLLAAGYATSFHGALGAVGHSTHLNTKDSTVTARVGVGKFPDGGMGFTLELVASVPNVTKDEARQLIGWAAMIDPFIVALKGNIEVQLTVV